MAQLEVLLPIVVVVVGNGGHALDGHVLSVHLGRR